MKRLLLFAAASLVLAACHPVDTAPRAALALEDCRLPGVDGAARCGTFDVWEDRSAKKGRRSAE